LLFAINVGLPFETPEMLFDGQPLNFEVVSGVKVDKKYVQKDGDREKEEAK